MKLRLLLPPLALFFLAASMLLAQQSAAPEHFRIAGVFQLPVLTQHEFKQLSSQAEAGDREAQYWLALLYNGDGKFVPRDSTKFLDWLNKSAEQGYAPAQQALEGFVNRNLFGTNRDFVKAEMYLLLGAEQGNADSQFWLGVAYEQNRFGTTNVKKQRNGTAKPQNRVNQMLKPASGRCTRLAKVLSKTTLSRLNGIEKQRNTFPTWAVPDKAETN